MSREVLFAPIDFTTTGGRYGYGAVEGVPVSGDISSPFGDWSLWRQQANLGPHRGIDIAASEGTPVLCPAIGRVVGFGVWDGLPLGQTQTPLGNFITIDHGFGIRTIYAHLMERPTLVNGSAVLSGARIGKVGTTGTSTGPHLHWVCMVLDAKNNWAAIDPLTLAVEREPVGLIERIGLASAILKRQAHPYREADRGSTRIYTVERDA